MCCSSRESGTGTPASNARPLPGCGQYMSLQSPPPTDISTGTVMSLWRLSSSSGLHRNAGQSLSVMAPLMTAGFSWSPKSCSKLQPGLYSTLLGVCCCSCCSSELLEVACWQILRASRQQKGTACRRRLILQSFRTYGRRTDCIIAPVKDAQPTY